MAVRSRRNVVFEAKGEIASLADTINEMSDTLATFAQLSAGTPEAYDV